MTPSLSFPKQRTARARVFGVMVDSRSITSNQGSFHPTIIYLRSRGSTADTSGFTAQLRSRKP
jgi:hypothetical protein